MLYQEGTIAGSDQQGSQAALRVLDPPPILCIESWSVEDRQVAVAVVLGRDSLAGREAIAEERR